MTIAASTIGPSTYWYLTRATGIAALILLTFAVVVGVIDVSRLSSERWPRFVIDGVHRTASLLAVVFLVVHIVTTVLDSFAPISLIDSVIPFTGTYRPLWLGLGAVSSDLLLALVITSLVRASLGYRAWRAVHWLAYACWPVAVLHGLGTGSDTKQAWLLLINAICVIAVVAAVCARLVRGRDAPQLRVAGLAVTVVFTAGLVLWLPSGPLGSGWARRSGTPSALLTKPIPSATRHQG
jgi:sulfoxide reductase heme-binding subunit YedZ